jgi:hypothetical protein
MPSHFAALPTFINILFNRKLADWDSDDEFGPSGPKIVASRVVVLKHMFTKEELAEDATLLLDLKEDVREECSNLGEVTNVVLYDVCLFARFILEVLIGPAGRRGRSDDSQIQRPC